MILPLRQTLAPFALRSDFGSPLSFCAVVVSNRNSKSYMIRAYQLSLSLSLPTLPFPHRAAALSLSLTQIEVFISTKTKSRFVNRDRDRPSVPEAEV